MRPRLLLTTAALVMTLSAQARAASPGDPFERFNRWAFKATFSADRGIVLPIARIYRKLTPGPIGVAIHNFLTNLGEPVIIVNDILQGRMRRAGDDFARLATNSTIGVAGFIDLATGQGLPYRTNDFGITLGRWGVRPGPYLFLPILGPSDVRDAVGSGVDTALTPLTWVNYPGRIALTTTTAVVGILDRRVTVGPQLDVLISGAADPYETIKSVYLQTREAAIRGDSAAPVLAPMDIGAAASPELALEAPPLITPPPWKAPDATQPQPQPEAAQPEGYTAADSAPIITARAIDLGFPTSPPPGGA